MCCCKKKNLKIQKYYFDIFSSNKYFIKQPLSYSQTLPQTPALK